MKKIIAVTLTFIMLLSIVSPVQASIIRFSDNDRQQFDVDMYHEHVWDNFNNLFEFTPWQFIIQDGLFAYRGFVKNIDNADWFDGILLSFGKLVTEEVATVERYIEILVNLLVLMDYELNEVHNSIFSGIVWILRMILNIIQFISNIFSRSNAMGLAFSITTAIFRLVVDIAVFLFINLSQIILAINSRENELQADSFAYEIGYGRELISGLYLLQKISMNTKLTLTEKMKASHPHTADRIAHLEKLENMELVA